MTGESVHGPPRAVGVMAQSSISCPVRGSTRRCGARAAGSVFRRCRVRASGGSWRASQGVAIVCGAASFAGDHAGTYRRCGSAGLSKSGHFRRSQFPREDSPQRHPVSTCAGLSGEESVARRPTEGILPQKRALRRGSRRGPRHGASTGRRRAPQFPGSRVSFRRTAFHRGSAQWACLCGSAEAAPSGRAGFLRPRSRRWRRRCRVARKGRNRALRRG